MVSKMATYGKGIKSASGCMTFTGTCGGFRGKKTHNKIPVVSENFCKVIKANETEKVLSFDDIIKKEGIRMCE